MGFKYEAIKAYLIDHGVDASLAETMHAIYATQRLGGTAKCLFSYCFYRKRGFHYLDYSFGKIRKDYRYTSWRDD